MPVSCQFGDIVFADFGEPCGDQLGYRRLAIVVSDEEYERRGLVPVFVLSSRPHIKMKHFALELPPKFPTQYVHLDRIYGLKPEMLIRRIGSVDRAMLTEILKTGRKALVFMEPERYRIEYYGGKI